MITWAGIWALTIGKLLSGKILVLMSLNNGEIGGNISDVYSLGAFFFDSSCAFFSSCIVFIWSWRPIFNWEETAW